MAEFVFKFQSVLRQRQRTEEQRQRELASLLRQKLIFETQLRRAQQTISEDRAQMSDRLVGRVDVMRIRRHAAHAGQVTVRAREIAARLMTLHRQIEQARAAVLDAARKRKAVELLRQRHHRRWAAEQRRREHMRLDEVGAQMYARRMMEGAVA